MFSGHDLENFGYVAPWQEIVGVALRMPAAMRVMMSARRT
jgi:hypothetical protein